MAENTLEHDKICSLVTPPPISSNYQPCGLYFSFRMLGNSTHHKIKMTYTTTILNLAQKIYPDMGIILLNFFKKLLKMASIDFLSVTV